MQAHHKGGFTLNLTHCKNTQAYACELMRLLGRNRFLKSEDMEYKDRADIQALVRLLRKSAVSYPDF